MKLTTAHYEVFDARIHDDIRIAVVCDLHGAEYGIGQRDLLGALKDAQPHVVLLLGDIFDQQGMNKHSKTLVQALSDPFNCYFIFGNHEYKSGDQERICNYLEEINIPILAGDSAEITVNQTRIQIYGIDDRLGGKPKQRKQIADAASKRSAAVYSILAIHVPNEVKSYLHYGFDLMLSGHTHGGQIIIPGVLNGLYAPGQGFFPKFGGGRYDFGDQTLIISRGLSKKPWWVPRICNPPELTFVTLKPEP